MKVLPIVGYISKITYCPNCPLPKTAYPFCFEDLVEDPSVLLSVISTGQ